MRGVGVIYRRGEVCRRGEDCGRNEIWGRNESRAPPFPRTSAPSLSRRRKSVACPATLRVPPPVWRNWQTQRIQNPPPPKGLQVRFLSPASDPAPLRAGRWRFVQTPCASAHRAVPGIQRPGEHRNRSKPDVAGLPSRMLVLRPQGKIGSSTWRLAGTSFSVRWPRPHT